MPATFRPSARTASKTRLGHNNVRKYSHPQLESALVMFWRNIRCPPWTDPFGGRPRFFFSETWCAQSVRAADPPASRPDSSPNEKARRIRKRQTRRRRPGRPGPANIKPEWQRVSARSVLGSQTFIEGRCESVKVMSHSHGSMRPAQLFGKAVKLSLPDGKLIRVNMSRLVFVDSINPGVIDPCAS